MTAITEPLGPYLTQPERTEAYSLSFAAGHVTANDVRIAELIAIATERLADHLGYPAMEDDRSAGTITPPDEES